MNVAIASDHRGFEAKERIKADLARAGHHVHDLGCSGRESCDYSEMGIAGASAVSNGECDRGILLCGSGIGMSMAANKVRGIRAALCHDELTAEMSRRHNNANVLCLPADLVGEELMRRIIDIWLRTEFEGGRHERRLALIADYEEKHRCNG